jgi:hypothetical protein
MPPVGFARADDLAAMGRDEITELQRRLADAKHTS